MSTPLRITGAKAPFTRTETHNRTHGYYDDNLAFQVPLDVNSKRLVEVYLFCPQLLGKRERRGDFRDFFERRLRNLDAMIANLPVFLDQHHALAYSRYMGDDNGVLRLYVEDSAIEACSENLALKPGFLNRFLVHGCFPSWAKGSVYIMNPQFDEGCLGAGAAS